jgi:ABC-2 type transport system ATP-binding protein
VSSPIIRTERLEKHFGKVEALKGVDLAVETGTVLGMLGPNGAGKTTSVRILTTLLLPDGGHAEVDGLDVVKDAEELRYRIGLAGQSAAVDENLTGFENLEMVGRLYGLKKAEARRRSGETLERFGLSDASDRAAKTYSGGMRRRLDVAASLVGRPDVLFLDEPTTGLDPRSRVDVWAFIRELQGEGATILLTTQYLEEADRLADRITVIDVGEVIAEGTSDELKDRIGGEVLEVNVEHASDTARAAEALRGLGTGEANVDADEGRIRVPVGTEGAAALRDATRRLDELNITLSGFAVHRPTLDDVFMSLTGHHAEDGAEPEPSGRGRRRSKEKA